MSMSPSSGLIPPSVLEQLREFGALSLDTRTKGVPLNDTRFGWEPFFSLVLRAWQADPARAVAELHAAAGDDPYAKFGGYLVFAEFDPSSKEPLFLDLCDAGLDLMYERGLSSGHLTGYEAQRWIETHGDLRTSFDRIEEIAPPDANALTELLPELDRGEALMVAAMGPRSDDNQFYVEHLADGTYGAFSMRPRNTEEPTPMRCEEPTIRHADHLAGVLQGLGEYLRIQPYWAHEALQPFFTERRSV